MTFHRAWQGMPESELAATHPGSELTGSRDSRDVPPKLKESFKDTSPLGHVLRSAGRCSEQIGQAAWHGQAYFSRVTRTAVTRCRNCL